MEKPVNSLLAELNQQVSHILEAQQFSDRLDLSELGDSNVVQELAGSFNQLLASIEQKDKQLHRSEQLFKLISQHTADLIAVVDGEGKRIYNSPSYQSVLGYAPEELIGTDSYTQIHPDDRHKVQQILDQSFASGAGEVLEYRMQHKDGHFICFESTGITLQAESGEVECLVVVAHDISKRRKAERALWDREAFLQILLDNVPQGIFWKDLNSVYRGCNKTFAVLAGLADPQEIIDKTDYDLPWAEDAAENFRELDQKIIASGQPEYHVIHYVVTANQRESWIDTNKLPLRNPDGEIIGVVGTSEDITERTKAELALRESEQRGRILSESAFEGILIQNKCRVLCVNGALLEMLGYQTDEIVGMNTLSLIAPEYRGVFWQGIIWDLEKLHEVDVFRKDGTRFTAEVRSRAIPYQGEYARVLAIRDISDRKRAELELQHANAYLNAVIDNLGDGLLVADAQGNVGRTNPALLEIFDLRREQIAGKDSCIVFGMEINNLVTKTRTAITEIFTAEIQRPDGKIIKAVATAICQAAKSGHQETCIGSVILVRDITAEKEVDQMKTDFITNVSHELRTPLTKILGFIKLINKKLEDHVFPKVIATPAVTAPDQPESKEQRKLNRSVQQVRDNLGIISGQSQHLMAIITDVLDIAQMEAGKLDWQMQPLAIEALIEQIIATKLEQIQAKGLELTQEFAPDLPLVHGDRGRLIQVMNNLLANAIKFTEDGRIIIKVTTDAVGQNVVVSIIDTGVGISSSDRNHLFLKFKQVGDVLTNKPQGTGLGLSISKQIINHHGGKIWVESQLGQGSTFSFSLPVAKISKPSKPSD
ncbi:PAS domain-containing sensor histidine kinase [Thalassoporum mexicanum]|uniref:PAS domain-containing sensor histidine kinase n=1 Tax=Thalassoporum mexicanum TaxID=3457544 RepID=UPI000685B8F0|nr:PAS domain S-box protein [Pseudanabaena sp. PCC 7367]